jgi:hypothetical protein
MTVIRNVVLQFAFILVLAFILSQLFPAIDYEVSKYENNTATSDLRNP